MSSFNATPLDKTQRRDIVIIGGGIIGCTSAYYLSRHSAFNPALHTITLLEAADAVAPAASGKAGGLLATWAYPAALAPWSFRQHRALADAHNGPQRWGYRAVRCASVECVASEEKPAAEPPIRSLEGRGAGTDEAVSKEGEVVSLQKRPPPVKHTAAGAPDDLDWINPSALRAYNQMSDYDNSAQVHPHQFTTAMAALAREKGVDVRLNARVSKITYDASGKSVEGVTYSDSTSGETTLPATDILVSAGPWTPLLVPDAPISALRAHSVTIRPSQPVSAYALFTEIRIPGGGRKSRGETVSPEIYARPNDEVYACGAGDATVPLPPDARDVEVDPARCEAIVAHVGRIAPPLADGKVLVRQACYLPSVEAGSGNPMVGPTSVKGLWLAAGHTCWGIMNAPATGWLVSRHLWGMDEEDGAEEKAVLKKAAKDLDPRPWV